MPARYSNLLAELAVRPFALPPSHETPPGDKQFRKPSVLLLYARGRLPQFLGSKRSQHSAYLVFALPAGVPPPLNNVAAMLPIFLPPFAELSLRDTSTVPLCRTPELVLSFRLAPGRCPVSANHFQFCHLQRECHKSAEGQL